MTTAEAVYQSLAGRVVFVTGGGSGIGASIVEAFARQKTKVAFVDLKFPSGVLSHVELSWLAPSKLRRTVLVGSEKMVLYDDASAEPVRVFDQGVVYKDPETFGEYHLSYRTGDIVSPRIETYEPLSRQFDDFLTAVAEERPLNGRAMLARNVVQLLEQAERSLHTGDRHSFEASEALTA